MLKKTLLTISVIVCTLIAVQAGAQDKMDLCAGVQLIMKDLIAGKEQTTIKGKVNVDDATYFNCRVLITDWQGVLVSEPAGEFRITYYKEEKDEKPLMEMFARMKAALLKCPLTDGALPVTIDEPDNFTFSISGVTIMVRLLHKAKDFDPNLIMLVTKKM